MKLFSRLFLVLILSLSALSAIAQTAVHRPFIKVLPQAGTYFNDTRSGHGWTVDVGRDGFVFIAFYTYSNAGMPTFYVAQGQFIVANEAQRLSGAMIGFMDSPIYESVAGACIACPYIAPNVRPSALGNARFVWTSPQSLRMEGAGVNLSMAQLMYINPADGPEKQWEGVWRETRWIRGVSGVNEIIKEDILPGQIRFERTNPIIRVFATAGNENLLPTADEVQYRVRTLAGSSRFGRSVGAGVQYILYLNLKTGAMRGTTLCMDTLQPDCMLIIDGPGGRYTEHALRNEFGQFHLYAHSKERISAIDFNYLYVLGQQEYNEFNFTRYTPELPLPALQ